MSYYEWVQNLYNQQWEEEEVLGKLQRKMERSTVRMVEMQTELRADLAERQAVWEAYDPGAGVLDDPDLRTSATVVAVDRTLQAALDRGVWP